MSELPTRVRMFKCLLPLLSVVITFLILELSARTVKGKWGFRNFWLEDQALLKSTYPVEFHPEFGWIPKPGYSGKNNYWGKNVTIDTNGLRIATQSSGMNMSEPILAVGDSFTFGDQVSDGETWPAQLERLAGKTVINGGVFGYGFDQTYLRMLELNRRHRPSVIIMQLIPEDIDRCELSVRTSVPKPYFTIEDNSLVVHVDHIRRIEPVPSFLKKTGGYSYIFNECMERAFPSYWKVGSMEDKKAHDKGDQIASAIINSLNSFVKDNANVVRLIILAQYRWIDKPTDAERLRNLIRCRLDPRITFCDTYDPLELIRKNDPPAYRLLYAGHMTSGGNAFIAAKVWVLLSQRGEETDSRK